jgi:hypothetical protein
MNLRKTWWVVPFGLGLCACSGGDHVDIGDDKVEKTGEKLSDYAASWEGYAEAYAFDGGSDAIRVVLDENGAGTVDVGDAAPLPPPDPDLGYPPASSNDPFHAPLPEAALFSGFSYTVLGAVVENRRLRFGLDPREIYKEWCELQTPILDEANSTPEEQRYACVPNWGFMGGASGCSQENPDTGEITPIDCGKLYLCELSNICNCTAEGCSLYAIDTSQGYPVMLDAALQSDGDELEGTLTVDDRVIVRMTRN